MSDSDRSTLRVAVNAYFRRHSTTGSGQYLNGLLSALPEVDGGCRLELFGPDTFGRAIRVERASEAKGGSSTSVSAIAKLVFEQVGLPWAVGHRAEVVHYPYWAAPLYSRLATVVTVHDLIPLLLASYRGKALVRSYTRVVSTATRRATMIIADSLHTKTDVIAHLRVPAERVRVIHLAPHARYREEVDPARVAGVRRKYGLDQRFVFYVGGLDRRKNVDRLIVSFAKARPALDSVQLVIAGRTRPADELFADLQAVARANNIEDDVRFLGSVTDEEMVALYHAAEAFAYPSMYEGFGLPPLEAMACGTPVLCSNASSLPEVCGDAALLLDPNDEDAWAASLVRAFTDEALRSELRGRGLRQSARFDWRRTASETFDVYKEAYELHCGKRWTACAL